MLPKPMIPSVVSRSSRALQRLPRPLRRQLQELGQAAVHGEDHHQDVLGDRPAEDAAPVRDGEAPGPARRRHEALHAGRRRVDPAQVRAPGRGGGRRHPRRASRGGGPRRRRAARRPGPRATGSRAATRGRPRGWLPGPPVDSGPRGSARGRSRGGRRPARCPVPSPPGPRRARADDAAQPALRPLQLAVARQRLRALPEAAQAGGAGGCDPPPRRTRSPRAYCSILRSSPVIRRIARSIGVRAPAARGSGH